MSSETCHRCAASVRHVVLTDDHSISNMSVHPGASEDSALVLSEALRELGGGGGVALVRSFWSRSEASHLVICSCCLQQGRSQTSRRLTFTKPSALISLLCYSVVEFLLSSWLDLAGVGVRVCLRWSTRISSIAQHNKHEAASTKLIFAPLESPESPE